MRIWNTARQHLTLYRSLSIQCRYDKIMDIIKRKEEKMKNRLALILAAFLAAGVTGCTVNSTQPEQQADSEVTTESAKDIEIVSEETSAETQEEKTEDTKSSEQEKNTENKVVISYATLENDRTLEDGTVIVYISYQRPTVTVEGNDNATSAIKQDFDSDEEAFNIRGDEIEAEARAFFTDGVSEDNPAYANSVEYTEKRVSGRVISFERLNYSNLGGVHGNTYVSGLNFDSQTGERLTLDDIAEDRERFLAAAKEYVLSLCESDEYKELLIPDYQESLDSILQDDLWFFDEEGITFIANTYELASYAAGTLRFTVPYGELEGLKTEYKK